MPSVPSGTIALTTSRPHAKESAQPDCISNAASGAAEDAVKPSNSITCALGEAPNGRGTVTSITVDASNEACTRGSRRVRKPV